MLLSKCCRLYHLFLFLSCHPETELCFLVHGDEREERRGKGYCQGREGEVRGRPGWATIRCCLSNISVIN